jgi:hypothetical protein
MVACVFIVSVKLGGRYHWEDITRYKVEARYIQISTYPTSLTSPKRKVPHTTTNWHVTQTTYYRHWLNSSTIGDFEEPGQLT